MKIGFTADSSSGLKYAPFKTNALITKTTIHFKEEELVDGVDITADEFYEKLEKTDIIPTTSAPLLGEVLTQIEALKEKGYTDVIHFPISSNLSLYGKNLKELVDPHIEGINFHVCDTYSATLMQGYLVKVAEHLATLGKNVLEIKEIIGKLRENMNAYFIVDDLRYLIKNGRLSSFSGTIGILAKVKPILALNEEGKITTKEKIRTHHKALSRMFELIVEETKNVKNADFIVLHTNRLEDAKKLSKKIKEEIPCVNNVLVSTITPTVGAHIGSKILGAGYIIKDGFEDIFKSFELL